MQYKALLQEYISFMWLIDLWPKLDRCIPSVVSFPPLPPPSVGKICRNSQLGRENWACVNAENLGKTLEKAVLNNVCCLF